MGQPRGSNGNPQQENIMKMIRQLQEDVNRQSEELLSLRQQNDEILKVKVSFSLLTNQYIELNFKRSTCYYFFKLRWTPN